MLEARQPGLAERVLVPVCGDVSLPRLGLSEADRALLRDKVSVVFHGAATVRFDQPIQSTVIMNLRGTRELADLAVGMKKLQVSIRGDIFLSHLRRTKNQGSGFPIFNLRKLVLNGQYFPECIALSPIRDVAAR